MGGFQTMCASCPLAPGGSLGLELSVCLFFPELVLNHLGAVQQFQSTFEYNGEVLVVVLNTIYTSTVNKGAIIRQHKLMHQSSGRLGKSSCYLQWLSGDHLCSTCGLVGNDGVDSQKHWKRKETNSESIF